jgi:hypothetical protein
MTTNGTSYLFVPSLDSRVRENDNFLETKGTRNLIQKKDTHHVAIILQVSNNAQLLRSAHPSSDLHVQNRQAKFVQFPLGLHR